MQNRSLFQASGLPEDFGTALVVVSFVLLLAPYLSGADFGVLKIPQFTVDAKRRLRIIGPVVFGCAILLFLPLLPSSRIPEISVDPATRDSIGNRSVAMIHVEGDELGSFHGAGVIVGASSRKLYIVTAAHLVSRNRDETADSVFVLLDERPGDTFKATIERVDSLRDLALVSINVTPERGPSLKILDQGGNIPRAYRVFPVGFPGGQEWGRPVTPAFVSDSRTEWVRMEMVNADLGYSGAGLFDNCGNLVGIVLSSAVGEVEALSAPLLIDIVEGWGVRVRTTRVDELCTI